MAKNLVLIGMPGCGKSSVGRALAALLGMPLADTDELVEHAAGRSIPDIFASDGEAAFRELESAAVRTAAAMSGTVVATGGGAVLREENMAALRETGVVFFLHRELSAILNEDHSGRPLAGSEEALRRLYEQRLPLYRKYAHYTVGNAQTVAEAAEDVAALYRKECTL